MTPVFSGGLEYDFRWGGSVGDIVSEVVKVISEFMLVYISKQ